MRINNERLAEFCATYPERFVAFRVGRAAVPGARRAAARARGEEARISAAPRSARAAPGTSSRIRSSTRSGRSAKTLDVLVFIHPQSTPELAKRFKGNGWLANTIGNPLDTTICLSQLIFEGTLDAFPRLKLCSAHGGGFLPSYAPRSDHACRVGPDQCNPAIKLKKKPTEYLREMYFDTLVFTSEALRHLAAEVGASQLVIGTDHPIPWNQNPVDHI